MQVCIVVFHDKIKKGQKDIPSFFGRKPREKEKKNEGENDESEDGAATISLTGEEEEGDRRVNDAMSQEEISSNNQSESDLL